MATQFDIAPTPLQFTSRSAATGSAMSDNVAQTENRDRDGLFETLLSLFAGTAETPETPQPGSQTLIAQNVENTPQDIMPPAAGNVQNQTLPVALSVASIETGATSLQQTTSAQTSPATAPGAHQHAENQPPVPAPLPSARLGEITQAAAPTLPTGEIQTAKSNNATPTPATITGQPAPQSMPAFITALLGSSPSTSGQTQSTALSASLIIGSADTATIEPASFKSAPALEFVATRATRAAIALPVSPQPAMPVPTEIATQLAATQLAATQLAAAANGTITPNGTASPNAAASPNATPSPNVSLAADLSLAISGDTKPSGPLPDIAARFEMRTGTPTQQNSPNSGLPAPVLTTPPTNTGSVPPLLASIIADPAAPLTELKLTAQVTNQPVSLPGQIPMSASAQGTFTASLQSAYSPSQIVVPNVAFEIARNFNAGTSRFQIRLDPPELGRIDVRMNLDDNGNVTARLIVDRPETLDLLQRDARVLERALAQAGMDSGRTNLEFTLNQNGLAQNGNDGGDGEQNQSPSSDTEQTGDDQADVAMVAYQLNISPGGISIWA